MAFQLILVAALIVATNAAATCFDEEVVCINNINNGNGAWVEEDAANLGDLDPVVEMFLLQSRLACADPENDLPYTDAIATRVYTQPGEGTSKRFCIKFKADGEDGQTVICVVQGRQDFPFDGKTNLRYFINCKERDE